MSSEKVEPALDSPLSDFAVPGPVCGSHSRNLGEVRIQNGRTARYGMDNDSCMSYDSELDCAVRAADAAGAILREAFHDSRVSGHFADHSAEQQILGILSAGFPTYGYRGEELGLVMRPTDSTGHLWLVDPDDGTGAFEKGFRGAAVSIALLRDGRPVLGVVYAYSAPDDGGDLFTWAEGTDCPKRNGKCVPRPGDETLAAERIVLLSIMRIKTHPQMPLS